MRREEILALVKRRQEAWAARDPAALAATHAENGTVASPTGGVLEGRDLHVQMLDCDASFLAADEVSYMT